MTTVTGERDGSLELASSRQKRVTATEMVGSVVCQITLEQDDSGCYREVELTPLRCASEPDGLAR